MSAAGHPVTSTVHATCVAFDDAGILIMGPSGAGKSDLALRLIDQGGYGVGSEMIACSLVSDDQVVLTRKGDGLFARAPETIAGMLEVRGVGIVRPKIIRAEARIRLVVTLVDAAAVERMPDFGTQVVHILGVSVPDLRVCAKECSAPAKIRCALQGMQKQVQIVDVPV